MTIETRSETATSAAEAAHADASSLLDEVVLAASEAAGDGEAMFPRFVRAFYTGVPANDLARIGPADALGGARSIFELARVRRAGEPNLRVFNPDPARDGWSSPCTVVEIVNDDMPFLVDSLTHLLNRAGARTALLIHPIVAVTRDSAGVLLSHAPSAADGHGPEIRESVMQIRVRRQPPVRLPDLRAALERGLASVRLAVDDFAAMRGRLEELVRELRESPPPLDPEEVAEVIELLRWLDEGYFTFLGYREVRWEGSGEQAVGRVLPDRGLGLLRDPDFTVFEGMRHLGRLPPEVRHFVQAPHLARITKANTISPVHRATHLDSIAVKSFDEAGQAVGERLFVGLFTSAAYTSAASEVPIIRRKVSRAIQSCGFPPGSHNDKTLVHILETYPRDELFQIKQEDLDRIAVGILHAYERQWIALFTRLDPFERFVSCLVYVPRERFDTRLRERFQAILEEAFAGTVTTYYTLLTDHPLARLHFLVKTTPGQVPIVDVGAVEERLIESGESWQSRLETTLLEALGDERGSETLTRFERAFPAAYREEFSSEDALDDIAAIGRLRTDRQPTLRLFRRSDETASTVNLIVLTELELPLLSDVLPVLERMGLLVLYERSYRVEEAGATAVWLRVMRLRSGSGSRIDLERAAAFEEAFRAVWRRDVENDGFNRLVLFGGLSARQVTLLRACARFLVQARAPFSRTAMQAALAKHERIARRLWRLFEHRFDPDGEDGRNEAVARLRGEIGQRLEDVVDLDEDRILRRILNVIESTLRTNYFQSRDDGSPKPYLALKLDSRALSGLPEPRPWREIWVHGTDMEGVHLRGGRVARGGIRWSDRREDFRTEVLGLMKAQRVKNAVIVPEGSKGGFVVRRPSSDREVSRRRGVAAYEMLIQGLLDLTDNIVDGQVVPPPRTVRADGDDPYLVVAADKGTATFSDRANGIAARYGFWLGDAFASGVSAGYDHKKMGITARGAWESVKRHFRELGKDIQSEPFTVIGVGDMSGDVFGNGMLLSRQIRLVAAFDHRHVFLDPHPDPESSWLERQRVFELPTSSWADYDRSLLSRGGGVYERSAKAIAVTHEAASVLGIDPGPLVPAELIRAILRAPLELLWFGGIGTFVKASDESQESVGDRANEALRVDGSEVRAAVVGEGANLGLTQLGRIECALRGVRLNTDFIDNSAGVDTSDHEVNLKILLDDVARSGRLDRDERDRYLREMEEEVAALVLRSNYLQPQAISVTQFLGTRISDRLARVMRSLERSDALDRRIEWLPDEDGLEERRRADQPLFTRPELAVLSAYVKLDLERELGRSPVLDEEVLVPMLRRYFPTRVRETFGEEMLRHPLRREILATMLANEMVNRVGLAFAEEVTGKTGRTKAEVARAYSAARDILAIGALWRDIEALDNQVPAAIQAAMLAECGRLVESCTVWVLRHATDGTGVAALVDSQRPCFARLVEILTELVPQPLADQIEIDAGRLESSGVPRALAVRVAQLRPLSSAFDIVLVATARRLQVEEAARVYFAVGDRLGFEWARHAARSLAVQGVWDRLAIGALVEDLFRCQARLAESVIALHQERSSGAPVGVDAVAAWVAQHEVAVVKTEQLLGEMRSGSVGLGVLTVAQRQLAALAEG
ncbi:MAG TPA: NAD-glutamate dehydrogenase [Thermoanaerobaculia bacterium]|nr:NAD-glutamate dehydrogenase [Thermoanaerobaculia bacterium]